MLYSVSSVEDFTQRCDEKFVINGSILGEHNDLFKQINNDVFVPVKKRTSDLDLRAYYVLESKKNGKLFDVVMLGEHEDSICYDVIIPFLPNDKAKELEDFVSGKKF